MTLALSPSSISENGGVSTVTATLSTAATAAVTVTVSASAVSPAGSVDEQAADDRVGRHEQHRTVTITAVDNSVDTDNKSVTVSATASGGGVRTLRTRRDDHR